MTNRAPEQPLVPQLAAAGRGEHVPSRPASAQAPQSDVQAVSQQTASAQKPLAHSPPVPQGAPSALMATHLPPLQYPVVQSADVVHPVAHAPAAQDAYGAQLRDAPCGAPLATAEQVPSFPATSHAWQLPLQAASQQ